MNATTSTTAQPLDDCSNTSAVLPHSSWLDMLRDEPWFYARQIFRLLALAYIGVVFSTICLFVFYNHVVDQLVGTRSPLFLLPDDLEALSAILPALMQTLVLWTIAVATITGVTVLFAGMFMIGKFAAPMIRLKHALREIGNGDLSITVELDDGDEFQDLSDTLNQTLAHLQLMVMASKDNVATIEQLQREDIQNERLERASALLRDALDYFETTELPSADSDEAAP